MPKLNISKMLLYVQDENLLYINNRQQIYCHSHGLPSDQRWSISADLVQSRFTQIGPRSVSELESVLTLKGYMLYNVTTPLTGFNETTFQRTKRRGKALFQVGGSEDCSVQLVMGDCLRVDIPPQYKTRITRLTQSCIPPWSLNQVLALISRDKDKNVSYAE